MDRVAEYSADGQLLIRRISFSQMELAVAISAYLRSPGLRPIHFSAENNEIVERILRSFRFDRVPIGDDDSVISAR